MEWYEQGLEARPEHKALNFNAAQAAYQLGEYEKAVEFYEQAEDSRDNTSTPATVSIDLGMRQGYERKTVYNQALEMYKEGIMQYPQDLELKFNYEFVKQNLQELSEQMEQMEQESEGQDDQQDEGQDGDSGLQDEEQEDEQSSQQNDEQDSSGDNQQDDGQNGQDSEQDGEGEGSGENQDDGDQEGQGEQPEDDDGKMTHKMGKVKLRAG